MNTADISAAVRTVTDIDAHFEEFKQRVVEVAERVDAQSRGFFTPAEEEQTLGLLVSYWQSRAALLELITDFRSDDELSETDRPSAFLAAFAGALLLVDAARFLREKIHEKRVIRKKLNQEAPEFGIPARVYDTVQESLLKTRHAWHLYHAAQFFHEHEALLRGLPDEAGLQSVMDIVDRLRSRLDVSLAQLARVKLRARASHTMRNVIKGPLQKALHGLQKLAGTMVADVYVRPKHQPQLPDAIVAQLRNVLLPGDVLVVRKEYALTNYFLPGYWPHAALYLGHGDDLRKLGLDEFEQTRPRWSMLSESTAADDDAKSPRVLEAKKDGVRIRSLASPCAADSVLVLRPLISEQDRAAALARALGHEGKRYDFTFDFRRSDQLVCTEVVYRAYDGIGNIRVPLIRRAGRPTLAGQDLLEMAIRGECFEAVAVFEPEYSDQLVTDAAVMEVVKQKESATEAETANSKRG
ncbi:MAG: hypothetical protein IH991_07430 [Planctomycetes bacterium]|nr:hypothetical protein [Planctomycetota bacterium]